MSIRTLRIWSGVGAGVLVAGVVLLAVGVALWKPLSTAPELWTMGTWGLLGAGIIVTVLATTTLAARARQR
jgi:multisubunit Na+/H+ antiporter MnhB subunit